MDKQKILEKIKKCLALSPTRPKKNKGLLNM